MSIFEKDSLDLSRLVLIKELLHVLNSPRDVRLMKVNLKILDTKVLKGFSDRANSFSKTELGVVLFTGELPVCLDVLLLLS